jgi:hypothetical protein
VENTATAVPPTDVSTPTPTLFPLCTPPACAENEVYFCPGDCPGGCGTVCATVTPGVVTAVPLDWDSLATWLHVARNAYSDPAEVHLQLQNAGWQQSDDDWLAADLDGDGQDEWALLLYQPDMDPVAPHNLWVVNGSGLMFQYYDEPNLIAGFSLQLKLTGTADLTGDSRSELITNEESCGAHTCFGGYQVLTAANGTLHNIVSNPDSNDFISISYPDTNFSDYNQDGVTDFIVHGGEIGSAGAGIVRTYSEVWAWDGTAVTLAATILDDTQYRHHILYEANDLMAAGDLDQAILLYEQAINDDNLIESPYASNDAETYANIAQFAAFRLILIDLRQGNNDSAQSRLDWLNATYPETAVAEAAAILINDWSNGEAAACTAVENSMQTYGNPTGVLEDQGYGNPSLTAADFCP